MNLLQRTTRSWVRPGLRLAAAAATAVAGAAAAVGVVVPPEGTVAGSGADAGGAAIGEQLQSRRAHNVIFLLGDGMGRAHRRAVRLATEGRSGQLAMDALRHRGRVGTAPAAPNGAVTDSAAAATAYATGVKTYNGAVGVDVDGTPVRTLLERARAHGKATGLVTTSQVTDASPAAFGAHVRLRGNQSEIARQYLVASRPDVILGGGEDWWLPPGAEGAWPDRPAGDPTERSRGTAGNLVRVAKRLGYDHISSRAELRRSTGRKLLGLFANEEMFEPGDEGEDAAYAPAVPLPAMARKALDVLSHDPDGFFLLIEEEGIDGMAHRNNAHLTIAAGRALDRTVRVARRFADDHPETLVVVVGDHETGGLTVETNAARRSESAGPAEDGPFPIPGTRQEFTVRWTTTGHTGADVPLTAEGPGAWRLAGPQRNTDVHDAVLRAMRGDRR